MLEGKIFKVLFAGKKTAEKSAFYSFTMQSFDSDDKNPIYMDCKVWDDLAEQIIDRKIGKGDIVKVLGNLRTRKTENREYYFIGVNTMQEVIIKDKEENKNKLISANDKIPF